VLLLSLDLMPFGMEWMSSLLLAMLGISVWAWLWLNLGVKGLLLGALVFAFGVLLEYAGVNTGVPFGRYAYTGVLVPGLPGGVPLAIGFAWLFIVVGGLFTARAIVIGTRADRAMPWVASLLGAVLAVGLDLLLEPVAYHVRDYWEWEDAGPVSYYGVPWSNFAAWFAASLALNLLLGSLAPRGGVRWTWLPVALYAMNVVLFGVVNIAHGMWLPGVVAALLLLLTVWFWGSSRAARASAETEPPRRQGRQGHRGY
jgi:putative membrane protein